ncbi:MAG TPA: FAD:protein FMN transferase [Candidatus Bathyarchaeia archaeon]|nr:FAD:protein FMN transferase [Candidatus Bathyarchaeia archaeon]
MTGTDAKISSLALAALVILAAACAHTDPYTKETFVMGTKAWVTIAGMREPEAERAADAAFRELYRIESVMSNWRSTSEISRLNAGSNGAPFRVSPELYAIIDSSLFYARATAGVFDVTVRPLVVLWGFEGGEAKKIPTDEEIAQAMSHVGYEKVVLDRAKSTVTLQPGMQIDLAGVAKGYAVDRCVAVLRRLGVRDALVNLGGNIFAMGSAPGEQGWKIGIRDPKGGVETVGSIRLRDQAVATSGNYENFVTVEGKRWGHLIDPRTGRPSSAVLSATVVAPTGLASDALSKLFILGPDAAREAVARLPGVAAVFAVPDGGGISYRTAGDMGGRLQLDGASTAR